jgi:hypothetical protein
MIDIRSRAHRILQPMSHYYDLSECSGWLAALDFRPALGASEAVLGLYSLDIGGFSDAIVFTTLGLYLRSGQSWSPISYAEIERASAPTSKEHLTDSAFENETAAKFGFRLPDQRMGDSTMPSRCCVL